MLGSDAVNKELILIVKQVSSYVDRDESTNGIRPKALQKASNFSLGRAFVKRSAMFSCVGT